MSSRSGLSVLAPQQGPSMRCPACGFENASGIRFCGECGAPLKLRCTSCGCENAPGIKFCGECGKHLTRSPSAAPLPRPRTYTPEPLADRILAEQAAMEARGAQDGERKTITALFADIKSSVELMEGLDPEEARAIVDPALQLMMDAVHHYEGYVAQSRGDGIFALFGAPIAQEDHARRALYAALRMQEDMKRYSDRLRIEKGVPLQIRVGLNSGEMVLRSIRKDDLHADYVPIGHSLNLASRMESLATPGSIAVSENTYRMTQDYFRFRELGPVAVKGVREPVRVYDLEGIGALRTRLDVSRSRGFSRFVGRAAEMAALETALDRAIEGDGRVVGVVAGPGLGKSRLCFEFSERCRARGITVYDAHGISHGKLIPFLPVLEVFRAFFRITDEEDAQATRERIAGRMLLHDASLRDVLPFVFDFLDVSDAERPLPPMEPEEKQRRLYATVRRILQARSQREPAVFLLEDLHWFDSGSEGVLEVLVEMTGATRTLLVVNFRPEYYAAWMQRSYYHPLPLLSLGPEAITELLQDLLGTDPSLAGLGDRIRNRTGGNPFFIEEVVQVLSEAGSLVGDRGAYGLARPATELTLPATVQAVLAARIDRLEERDKYVLQTAAVIGKEFSGAVLKRVADLPETDLSVALTKLAISEFIYERVLYPELGYTFKHALTQEVAYGSLLVERRQAIHERTAEAIEALFRSGLPEHYAELAHHYGHSRNTEKAIAYSELAGQRAVQRSANAEAIEHLSSALERLKSLPETLERTRRELELQIALGAPLMAIRGYGAPEVGAAYDRALELCRKIGETPELFPVLFGLSGFYWLRAELRKARELAEQLLILAQRVGDPALLLQAHAALGAASFYLGEPTVAREHWAQAMVLYDPERHRSHAFVYGRDPGVVCLASAAVALWHLGYPDQALERSDEALALARKIAHPFSLAFALFRAAWLHEFCRVWPVVAEHTEAAIAISAEQGFADFLLLGTFRRGAALVEQGGTDEGIAQMRDALAAMPSRGRELDRPYYLAGLAAAYRKAGRTGDALVHVTEALALVEKRDERHWEAEIYRVKGELLLESGGSCKAETCFRRAIEIARRQSAKSLELRATTSLARLLDKQGRRAEARRMLGAIYSWFSEGFDTADLRDAKALLDALS
jgi:class 3 adenylate cyclase/predicted ATPase